MCFCYIVAPYSWCCSRTIAVYDVAHNSTSKTLSASSGHCDWSLGESLDVESVETQGTCFYVLGFGVYVLKTSVARRMTGVTSSNDFAIDILPRECLHPLDSYDILQYCSTAVVNVANI
jgi:hypothetical protein